VRNLYLPPGIVNRSANMIRSSSNEQAQIIVQHELADKAKPI